MDAQELFVHDRSQWQRAEGLHASLVHPLRILVFALELEGEVVRQVTALMVAAKQPQGVGIPHLQRP